MQGGDECNLSSVDYQDVTSQWISADFLDLRLRSSGYGPFFLRLTSTHFRPNVSHISLWRLASAVVTALAMDRSAKSDQRIFTPL